MVSKRYAWILVALLWVVALLNYLDRQIIFSVLPLLEKEMRLTGVEMGLLGTVFMWVYGLLSPFAGYLADRFGKRRVILASLLVWSAVTWATGHARGFGELLVARGLMGISEACYIPAALALIAGHHGEKSRSLATGVHISGIYAGIVLGGVGGGWMGERYGWRFPFALLGLIGIGYAVLMGLALRRDEGSETGAASSAPRFLESLRELAGSRMFLWLTVVFSTTSIANWIAYTWLPLFLYEKFGMTLARAGFTATFYIQAGSVAGILAGGRLADWWSGRSGRARLYTQAIGLAAAAPFLILVGGTGSQWLLLVSLVVFGLGRGMFDCNAMPVLCQTVRAEVRATGYGIYNFLGCIAGGVMAVVAGWMRSNIGLSASFQVAGVLLLVAAVMLARLAERRPQ